MHKEPTQVILNTRMMIKDVIHEVFGIIKQVVPRKRENFRQNWQGISGIFWNFD